MPPRPPVPPRLPEPTGPTPLALEAEPVAPVGLAERHRRLADQLARLDDQATLLDAELGKFVLESADEGADRELLTAAVQALLDATFDAAVSRVKDRAIVSLERAVERRAPRLMAAMVRRGLIRAAFGVVGLAWDVLDACAEAQAEEGERLRQQVIDRLRVQLQTIAPIRLKVIIDVRADAADLERLEAQNDEAARARAEFVKLQAEFERMRSGIINATANKAKDRS